MGEEEKLILASRQVGSKADHAFCELMSRMTHETARSDGKGYPLQAAKKQEVKL